MAQCNIEFCDLPTPIREQILQAFMRETPIIMRPRVMSYLERT